MSLDDHGASRGTWVRAQAVAADPLVLAELTVRKGPRGQWVRFFDAVRWFAYAVRSDYTNYCDFLAAVLAEADRLVGGRERADERALKESGRVAENVATWTWENLETHIGR